MCQNEVGRYLLIFVLLEDDRDISLLSQRVLTFWVGTS